MDNIKPKQHENGNLNAEFAENPQNRPTDGDLISRQAAKLALCKAVHKDKPIPCDNQTASCLWSRTRVCDYAREIDALPPVQPKHGKWLPDNNNPYEMRFVCSQCKTSERVPTMMYEPIWDYCPHCGADMKCSENPNS